MVRVFLLAALLACVGCLNAAQARDEVVIDLPDGDGSRQAGFAGSEEDAEGSGPNAITVGDDGAIYVLDQNNRRVLAIDGQRSQAEPEILLLPEELVGDDLAMVRNTLYLWNDGPVALKAEPITDGSDGRALRTDSGETDDYARSVFASMGSQTPGPLNDLFEEIGRSARPRERAEIRQLVPSRGLGDIAALVSFPSETQARVVLRRAEAQDGFLEFTLRSASRVGTVELLDIDSTGRPYALVEMIGKDEQAGSGLAVVRFTPDGVIERIYDLPINGDSLPTRRFVAIGPRGDVLFLRSEESRAQVLRLKGRDALRNGMLSPAPPPPAKPDKQKSKNRQTSSKIAVRPSNRVQIVERATSFESLTWKLSQGAYGPQQSCSGMRRQRRPFYLIGKLGMTVKGMPYCWGCKTSTEDFLAGLEKGRVAGNVCTRSSPRREMMGVDCSSFVSEVWGLSRHVTTAAMPGITRRLRDPWQLQPGDALNKAGSHIMLVLRLTPDRKVEVMEASPNACRGTVCRNVYSLGALMMRGYKPVRFRGLNDSNRCSNHAQRPCSAT